MLINNVTHQRETLSERPIRLPLRVTTWCFFPIYHSVLLSWIQTSLPLKPKIVFNKNKRIIWVYSFAKQSRGGLALFKSIFLRNRSLSKARWFFGTKRKIWKGNLYWTENRFKTKGGVWGLITMIYVTFVQKKRIFSFRFELSLSSYWQNIIFQEIALNFNIDHLDGLWFHILTKIVIFKYSI